MSDDGDEENYNIDDVYLPFDRLQNRKRKTVKIKRRADSKKRTIGGAITLASMLSQQTKFVRMTVKF